MRNNSNPISILFITSSFERTGSEVLLYNLIKGIDRKVIKPYLYAFRDGTLLKELPSDVAYFLPYYTRKRRREKLWRSFLKRLKKDPLEYQLNSIQKKVNAEIWYVNTIVVDSKVLRIAKQLGVKIITHFHELPNAYRLVRQEHLSMIIENSDVCIGCSQIVCSKIRELGHRNVKLLYSFIDNESIDERLQKSQLSKKDLGIDDDSFLWIISGTAIYEKGLDYVPSLLKELEGEKFRIIWLGQSYQDGLFHYVNTIVDKRWPGKVIFTGALYEQYYQYLMLADGLLMPSREDSFSLVMLEAAYLGKPIVSFNSGGVKEFVDGARGIVVDSWNAVDLANAMKKLMRSTRVNSKVGGIEIFTLAHQIQQFQTLIKDEI